MQNIVSLIARILIAAIFLMSGITKITEYSITKENMAGVGIPLTDVALILAIVVELICAALIIVGFKARWAAFVLFLFLIPTTYYFHNMFVVEAESANFLKNLAIMGGLLMLSGFGPGSLSVDKS